MSKIAEYLKIESPSAAFSKIGPKRPRWYDVADAVLAGAEALFWGIVQALPIVLWLACVAIVVAAVISSGASE